MIKKVLFFSVLIFCLQSKLFAITTIDITRGNLDPLPVAVSPLSISEKSEKLELNELLDRLNNITNEDIMEIKSIERTINHDVKSVEYFIKNQLDIFPSLRKYKEYIHFGLTSQDINNPSLTLILKDSINT